MINSHIQTPVPHRFSLHSRRRLVRCRGQTLVEYGLILAVVSIVAIGVLVNLHNSIAGIYSSINTQRIESAASQH